MAAEGDVAWLLLRRSGTLLSVRLTLYVSLLECSVGRSEVLRWYFVRRASLSRRKYKAGVPGCCGRIGLLFWPLSSDQVSKESEHSFSERVCPRWQSAHWTLGLCQLQNLLSWHSFSRTSIKVSLDRDSVPLQASDQVSPGVLV